MTPNYSSIRVIGFDLDQTLYPRSSLIDAAIQEYIYKKIAKHKDVPVERAKQMFQERYQGGKGLSGRRTLIALDIPRAHEIVQEALENADIASRLVEDPTVISILKDLSKNYDLDIITGSSSTVMQEKMEKLGIPLTLFNHHITGEHSKTSGEAFEMWLNYYPELEPDQFVYVGDRPSSDYYPLRILGIRPILVYQTESDPSINCPQLQTFSEISRLL